MSLIPGSYRDPNTGMDVFPERPEESLAQRVAQLEHQVTQLVKIVEILSKKR